MSAITASRAGRLAWMSERMARRVTLSVSLHGGVDFLAGADQTLKEYSGIDTPDEKLRSHPCVLLDFFDGAGERTPGFAMLFADVGDILHGLIGGVTLIFGDVLHSQT